LGVRENLIAYKKILSKFFNDNHKFLSKESLDKINTNPLRILDSKNPEDSVIIKKSPKLIDLISKTDLNNYEEIKKCLNDLGISIFEDLNLVRGLDYYCHTVFEFKTNELGSQNTLIGGGRYNGLIKMLGGKDIPGVGWAGGIERIMLLMKDIPQMEVDIHLAILDSSFKTHAIKIYDFLIKNNFSVYWNYKYNLKKSLSLANEKKVNYLIIVGENEKANNNFSIKNLLNGEQVIVSIDNILDHLK
jgi:histidyl-tRNA synthetase